MFIRKGGCSVSQVIVHNLQKAGVTHVLCLGTPRIHEYVQGASSGIDSLLLDIDHRYVSKHLILQRCLGKKQIFYFFECQLYYIIHCWIQISVLYQPQSMLHLDSSYLGFDHAPSRCCTVKIVWAMVSFLRLVKWLLSKNFCQVWGAFSHAFLQPRNIPVAATLRELCIYTNRK